MNKMIFLVILLISFSAFSFETTPTGISLDKEWKVLLNQYAKKNVVHQSWGYSHSERNYQNTVLLANSEHIVIDLDVLFAAAFLHDIGGLPGFEVEGVDHGVRSVEIAIPLLISWGFPMEKLDDVKEVIEGHIYYGPMPKSILAKLFRDADILDFLGVMGISRLLAANLELGKKPEIINSVKTINALMTKIPLELYSTSAIVDSKNRLNEMDHFLKLLDGYSFGGKAY